MGQHFHPMFLWPQASWVFSWERPARKNCSPNIKKIPGSAVLFRKNCPKTHRQFLKRSLDPRPLKKPAAPSPPFTGLEKKRSDRSISEIARGGPVCSSAGTPISLEPSDETEWSVRSYSMIGRTDRSRALVGGTPLPRFFAP